jgi:hypothetical protein
MQYWQKPKEVPVAIAFRVLLLCIGLSGSVSDGFKEMLKIR